MGGFSPSWLESLESDGNIPFLEIPSASYPRGKKRQGQRMLMEDPVNSVLARC